MDVVSFINRRGLSVLIWLTALGSVSMGCSCCSWRWRHMCFVVAVALSLFLQAKSLNPRCSGIYFMSIISLPLVEEVQEEGQTGCKGDQDSDCRWQRTRRRWNVMNCIIMKVLGQSYVCVQNHLYEEACFPSFPLFISKKLTELLHHIENYLFSFFNGFALVDKKNSANVLE